MKTTEMRRFLICLILSMYGITLAGQIDSYIGSYTGVNAENYFTPLADVLVSTFNAGNISQTAVDSQLHFSIRLVGSSSFILGDRLRYFTATTGEDFTPELRVRTSTFIGPPSSTNAEGVNGTVHTFPAGMGLSMLLFAIPQINISGIYNTEFSGRFLTGDTKGELGKITTWAAGLRHNIGQYFMPDNRWLISAGYLYQSLQMGTYLDFKSHQGSLIAGQQKSWWYYFGQVTAQFGQMNVNYEHYDGTTEQLINIDLKNSNPILIGAGCGLQTGVFIAQLQVLGPSPVITALSIGLKF